jgi:hypothetical protein
MTALTTPAPPQEDASLRPVPWRRMGWVTWRQHRVMLAGVAVFLGALAVLLWIVGLHVHQAYSAAVACRPASSAICDDMVANFSVMDGFLANGFLLQALPALIGAFVGAPLLAREMETGTFRYAWTQGIGRLRWALAKLVLLAIAVTVATGLFSLVTTWYYQPYFAASNPVPQPPLAPTLFDLRGIAFPAWTLAAFAIGALAGMLIRRVVPAIAATLAVYTGLVFAAGGFLRVHYLTPVLTSSLNVPGTAWITSQWWTVTRSGQFAWAGRPPMSVLGNITCPNSGPPNGKPTMASLQQCVAQHGYTQWTSYQPASRFWPFQWIEGGWLLVLSVLLIAVTVWLVRRRAA